MKQFIVAASMTLGALGAQAQPPKAPDAQGDIKNKVEAIYNAEGVYLGTIVRNAVDSTQIQPPHVHQSAPVNGPADVETSDDAIFPADMLNMDGGVAGIKDSVFGDGASGEIRVGNKVIAAGFFTEQLANARSLSTAITSRINDNVALTAGASTRTEDAGVGLGNAEYKNKNLTGSTVFVRIDTKSLESLGLDRGAISYIQTNIGSTKLGEETRNWTQDSVIDADTFTRYLSEYYSQTTTTGFNGIDSQKLLANAVFYIGKNGEVTLHLGVMHRDGQGTTGVVGATGKYYDTMFGIPVVAYGTIGKNIAGNESHQSLGGKIAITPHFTVGAEHTRLSGTHGKRYDNRVTAMVSLLPNTAEFTRPAASAPLDAYRIVGEILSAPDYRVGAMAPQGVVTQETKDPVKIGENFRDVAKPKPVAEEKPKPDVPTPEQPPETPDTVAPTLSLSGASTMSITVGGTYAELGATCTDDKDATCSVVTTGTVDVSTVGTYIITYTATDTAGNTSTLTRTVNIVAAADPAPVVGGAFASLNDMEISDQGGGTIPGINAGGVTDSINRTIVYSVNGLPSGLSINSNTGVISGIYDVFGPNQSFTVTVKAQATGSTKSATKQFTLTIRDDG